MTEDECALDMYLSYLQRLSIAIDGRPVGIVCYGPSLKILDENITTLPVDLCWISINMYPCGHAILSKINQQFDVFFTPSGKITLPYPALNIEHSYRPYGNSIYEVLLMLIALKVEQVFIFGNDGVQGDLSGVHYNTPNENWTVCRAAEYTNDYMLFNSRFPIRTGNTDISLCSPNSKYEHTQKVSWDEVCYLLRWSQKCA